jgi:CHAT domain-containing protein/tetratricopeptide (TPR) repeat protein
LECTGSIIHGISCFSHSQWLSSYKVQSISQISLSPDEVLPAVQPNLDVPTRGTSPSFDVPLSPQKVLPAVQSNQFPRNSCPSPLDVAIQNPDVVISLPQPRTIGRNSFDVQEEKADSLLCQGREEYRLGQYEGALKSGQDSLRIYREIKHHQGEGNVLNDLGLIHNTLRNYSKAIESHEQALVSFRKFNDRQGEGVTLGNLGIAYQSLRNYSKAIDLYTQALSIFREYKNSRDELRTLKNIGIVHIYLQNYPKAIEFYEKSLVVVRAIKDPQEEGNIFLNLGGVYADLQNYPKAIEYHEKSLVTARKFKDEQREGIILGSLGFIYQNLNNYPKALEYYEQSLLIARQSKDFVGEASALADLGLIYSDLGSDEKSLDYNKKSLSMVRKIKDRNREVLILNNLGINYFWLANYAEAIEYHEQALAIAREDKNRRSEAHALGNLAIIYDARGNYSKAIEYQKQSLAIKREIKDRRGEKQSLANLGISYHAIGNYGKAIEYQEQSLAISREIKDQQGEFAALSNLGRSLVKQEPELAIVVYKQSVNTAESIRQSNRLLPRDLQFSYTETVAGTYQSLADLLIKQGRLPEAQAVLELLKLKELNTYTRDLPKNSPGISFTPTEQKALDEFLNTYGTAATFARQLSDCAEIKCPKLTQLEDQRDRTNTIIREMLDRLRISLKDQVIDLSKLNTAEFNNAAKAIVNAQPGTVLIYPIITDTKIQFLLAFKAGTGDNAPVTFRAIDGETIKSETIFETAQTFRELLQWPNSDLRKLQATSQQLYRWLIKPLEPEINQPHIKHLVFATDRVTRNLPIAALHDGQNYLITKPYSLSTVTSATGTTPNALPPNTPKVLAVGASQFTGAPALPYVEAETNAIVQTTQSPNGIFPGDRLLNNEFTFNTLQSNLSTHNILHIATHGFLDAGNIDNSYLLTSNGEKIDKSKIQLLSDYGLNNIHLVILSACNTGTGGKNSDGLEIAGISHYFMQSGTKSVIASLWQVSDPATALFMQQFYQHLKPTNPQNPNKPTLTKAQAIQKIQQDFIQNRFTIKDAEAIDRAGVRLYIPGQLPVNSLAHPYYWAPFILIGNNL